MRAAVSSHCQQWRRETEDGGIGVVLPDFLTESAVVGYGHSMRTIYRAENLIDAHLVRGALEQAGIAAFVTGEYLTGAAGQLPAFGLVEVRVAEVEQAAAESVVRAVEKALCESGSIMAADDGDEGIVAV